MSSSPDRVRLRAMARGVAEPVLHLLVAYPYFSDKLWRTIAALPFPIRLLIDSGAFTAWNTGKAITLDGYCAALDALPVRPWKYFALDVVNDTSGTQRNLDEMLRRGYHPSPVLTPAEDVAHVDELFKIDDFIGVATYKPRRYKADQQVRLVNIMARAAGRKTHLLGLTSLDWVKLHRPYSVDSSTWLNGRKYGSMRLYVGRGRTRQVTRATFAKGLDAEIAEAVQAMGFDPYDLAQPGAWFYSRKGGSTNVVSRINTASWALQAIDMERAIGTATFFVVADSVIDDLIEAWHVARSLRTVGAVR